MKTTDKPSWWFVFYEDKLLLEKKDGTYTIPCRTEVPVKVNAQTHINSAGELEGIPCRTFFIDKEVEESRQYVMIGLRASYDYIEEKLYKAAGKASQILYWDINSKYCSACGSKTIQITPITKQCPKCKREFYPPIATAIIVLIRKEDSILLVRARNFRGTFHGLVAGFLETGETLEECVQREVMEETGLKVKNITYFGNQPWPYPSGLMVGFIADYESGEIKLQDEELCAGAFYTRDNLPEIPRKLSLARKLIDYWLSIK